MAKRSFGITLFGIFFLMLGLLWIFLIYQRMIADLSHQNGIYVSGERMDAVQGIIPQKACPDIFKGTSSANTQLSRTGRVCVFGLLGVEILCAFSYFMSGLSLVRNYPLGRGMVITTMFFDIGLKGLVVLCYRYLESFASPIMIQRDVFINYFIRDEVLSAPFANYVLGLKLIQPDFIYYAAIYGAYVFIVFFFFTRSKVIENLHQ